MDLANNDNFKQKVVLSANAGNDKTSRLLCPSGVIIVDNNIDRELRGEEYFCSFCPSSDHLFPDLDLFSVHMINAHNTIVASVCGTEAELNVGWTSSTDNVLRRIQRFNKKIFRRRFQWNVLKRNKSVILKLQRKYKINSFFDRARLLIAAQTATKIVVHKGIKKTKKIIPNQNVKQVDIPTIPIINYLPVLPQEEEGLQQVPRKVQEIELSFTSSKDNKTRKSKSLALQSIHTIFRSKINYKAVSRIKKSKGNIKLVTLKRVLLKRNCKL